MSIFRWWQKIKQILDQLYWTTCARNSQSLNFLVVLPYNLTQKNCPFHNILSSHFSTTDPKLTCQNKNVFKNYQNLGRKRTIVISYRCNYKSYVSKPDSFHKYHTHWPAQCHPHNHTRNLAHTWQFSLAKMYWYGRF